MTLQVEDFGGLHEASSVSALESILMKRYKGEFNSFWLSHRGARNPSLALLVRGDLANLHYFPHQSHPGLVPTGNVAGLSDGEMTVFHMDMGGEEVQVVNDAIIPFSSAVAAAKEFFASDTLPKSINWTEL
jgi:hypothetical protein